MLQKACMDSCTFGARRSSHYPDGTLVCPHRYRGRPIHWTHDNAIAHNNIMETAPPGYAEVGGLDSDLVPDGSAFSPENRNLYSRNSYELPRFWGKYFSWANVLNDPRAWQRFGQDRGSRFLGH